MEQLNQENECHLIDFQSSLTRYIFAIETLMKAIEKRERHSPHPCLSLSKPILADILDQTLQLKKMKYPLKNDTIPTPKNI